MLKISGLSLALSVGALTFLTLHPSMVRAQNSNANDNAGVASDNSGGNSSNGNGKKGVPEMGAVAAGSAVAVVAGGLVLLSLRRRRETPAA